MIRFESATKRYPDGTTAVDSLDLDLPAGQVTVLVGPSGCGKTTSLRMVNRMVEPTGGRVLLDGRDVMAQDPAKLRLGIGYVIQQAGLFPHRTVVDNVATVPRLLGSTRREARTRALEVLERVGLPAGYAERYPVQLSGGQQQRVGVARALAADPPVLLMDEPFSAVDPVVRAQLQQELLRLQGELGKTIVFVTHDIDEAVVLGDLVAVLREGGHLAQVDTPQRLLESPADDFVADFVGRDRGFRGLSFLGAADLPVEPYAGAVPPGGTFGRADPLRHVLDLAIASPDGRAVRVDEAGRPDGVVTHEAIARHLRERHAAQQPDRQPDRQPERHAGAAGRA
jgi:osmoprotectant transport system ATP-binding protein